MKDILLIAAKVNGIDEWRVYVHGEIIARFSSEDYAKDYMTYLKSRL